MNKLQSTLIDYMFPRDASGKTDPMACLHLWFGKSHGTDNEIRNLFGDDVEAAFRGEYDDWLDDPRGCLALMILVDQFPRNIFRHTVDMYRGADKAAEIIRAGHDWAATLTPEECLFVPCIILTHCEDLAYQDDCLAHYEKLEPDLVSEFHIFRMIFEEHRKIIRICGTFPHRDHFYGRETSEAGKLLMQDPTLRFDLPLICENGSVRFGNDPVRLWKSSSQSIDVIDALESLMALERDKPIVSADILLSDEMIATCKDIFRKFDKNGDNFLDVGELGKVMAAAGCSYDESQLRDMVTKATGSTKSEGLTFTEFAHVLQSRSQGHNEAVLRERFALFDRDGTGTITIQELRTCVVGMDGLVTDSEVETMLEAVDANADGVICQDEFFTYMLTTVGARSQTTSVA